MGATLPSWSSRSSAAGLRGRLTGKKGAGAPWGLWAFWSPPVKVSLILDLKCREEAVTWGVVIVNDGRWQLSGRTSASPKSMHTPRPHGGGCSSKFSWGFRMQAGV